MYSYRVDLKINDDYTRSAYVHDCTSRTDAIKKAKAAAERQRLKVKVERAELLGRS